MSATLLRSVLVDTLLRSVLSVECWVLSAECYLAEISAPPVLQVGCHHSRSCPDCRQKSASKRELEFPPGRENLNSHKGAKIRFFFPDGWFLLPADDGHLPSEVAEFLLHSCCGASHLQQSVLSLPENPYWRVVKEIDQQFWTEINYLAITSFSISLFHHFNDFLIHKFYCYIEVNPFHCSFTTSW